MSNRSPLIPLRNLKPTSPRRPPARKPILHPTDLVHRTPALLPVPLLGISVCAALATLWLNLTPITERVVSRLLKTRCKLSSLSLNPFRNRYSLNNLQLFDPRGRPLFSLQQACLSFSRNNGRRALDITLTRPELITIFDSYDFSESNWTLLARNFRSQNEGEKTETKSTRSLKQIPTDDKKEEALAPTSPPTRSGMQLNVSVEDGIVLSIRSDALGGKRLVDDLLIRDVQLRSEDFERFDSVKALVDNLSIRAIKSFPISSFPREFRTGARRYVRLMFSQTVMERLKGTKRGIKKLRENISFADEFILKDLPDMQGARQTAQSAQKMLQRFESLLDSGSTAKYSTSPSSEAVHSEDQQGSQERSSGNESGSTDDRFRELNEEYTPRNR